MGEPCFECHSPSHKRPCKCDAQAEIVRLQAEVDRLTALNEEHVGAIIVNRIAIRMLKAKLPAETKESET
jgi:hypothetical protein